MKTYVKPTVDVVELSVKENMAALPSGIADSVQGTYSYGSNENLVATVYDLTTANTSANL